MRRLTILIFLVFTFITNICAQQVHISAPLVEMPGCTSISDLYSVSINNFEQEAIECAMEVEIFYKGSSLREGLVARGQLSGSPIFNLPIGITQINTVNVSEFFPNRNIDFLDNTLNNINNTSSCLPPGEYEVCIILYGVNQNGQVEVQNQISRTCFKRIKTTTNNIFLISPYDKSDVLLNLPIFTWTPVATFDSRSSYIIEFVEILDHQTPFEAFRSNPIYFSQAELKTNTFQYPISARSFEPCRNYVWRVGFYEDTGFDNSQFREVIEPTINSEIWQFRSDCRVNEVDPPTNLFSPTLIQPSAGAMIPSSTNMFFIWNTASNIDQNITYQLRVVEKKESQTANIAFLKNPVIYTKNLSNINYHYWIDSATVLDEEKEYVWGIVSYDEDGLQLFTFDELESNHFRFGTLPLSIKMDCPYEIEGISLISKEYFLESNHWIIDLDVPSDNADQLLNSSTPIEIDGQTIDVPPFLNDFTYNSNNNDISISTITNNNFSIRLKVESSNNIKDGFDLCVNRTITTGTLTCGDQKCININTDNRKKLNPLIAVQKEPCILEIKNFRESEQLSFNNNSQSKTYEGQSVQDYFKTKFSFVTTIPGNNTPGSPYLRVNQRIHFKNINASPVSVSVDSIANINNAETKYIIIPKWNEDPSLDSKNKELISFSMEACLSVDVLDKRTGDFICTRTECIPIEHKGKLAEDDLMCGFDITEFEVSTAHPKYSPNRVPQVIGPWASGTNYLLYKFNTSYDLLGKNCIVQNKKIIFQELYTNVPLQFWTLDQEANQYSIFPIWEEASSIETGKINDVVFAIDACLSYDIISVEDALNPEFIATVDTCIIISYGDLTQTIEEIKEIPDTCSLVAKIKIRKDNNNAFIFTSILKNHNPDLVYTYNWEFSDGQSASYESTTNVFSDPDQQSVQLTVIGQDINGNECEVVVERDIIVRPGCDYLACDIDCSVPFGTSFNLTDTINLCGGLVIKITSLTNNSPSNLTGVGTVWIPWLRSDIFVQFAGITINNESEFCAGEIYAQRSNNNAIPPYPQQLAINAAYDLTETTIRQINNYINNANGVLSYIPNNTVLNAAQNQVNPLRVPIGFTNVPNGSPSTTNITRYTLGIADLKFTPGQNYIKAIAAVDLPADDFPGDATLYFQSDHFFFNSSGPILSTGSYPDFRFEITQPTKLQYGTNDGDPLFLTFNGPQQNGSWGTSLALTSECNEPYEFCLSADIDIEMPRSWVEPINDPNPQGKVTANKKLELCNFKDFITQISLPNCLIANTEGLELEVEELTWDHSSIRNADNFEFPENYTEAGITGDENEFKGFFLKSATVKLPEELSTYDDHSRLEVSLENWIMHKGFGISGKILADNIVNFPNMNVSDLGASIDTFRLEIVNNEITKGYLKGEITLPICDYDDPDNPVPVNRLDYKGMYGSYPENTVDEGLLFLVTPQQNYECPFFANGELEIYNSSKLYVMFSEDHSAIDFSLNGKLNFPDKEIGPVSLQMDANFEDLGLNYTNYKSPSADDVFLFNYGVWSFASPQKKISDFNFTIENFKSVNRILEDNELYAGGVGFDAVVNLSENVGGSAGVQFLGAIKKNPEGRLTAELKKVSFDSIGIYANLSGAKLDGYVKFINDPNKGKAVEGFVDAKFNSLGVGIKSSLLFGNTFYLHPNTDNGYRYFKVEASAIWPIPGIPLFPGLAMRGVGAGFYKNMNAEIDDTFKATTNTALFQGATFIPEKGTMGLSLLLTAASTPKEEGFNGDLILNGEFSNNGGGIQSIGLTANVWSGAKILERNKAWLVGNLNGNYDFPDKELDVFGDVEINVENDGNEILTGKANLKFKSNAISNKYYYEFGRPDNPVPVTFMNSFSSGMYLMFGNYNITAPTKFLFDETTQRINEYSKPPFYFNPPDFSASNISTGKGFATGLGIKADGEAIASLSLRNLDIASIKAYFEVGAEFHLNMLDYGLSSNCGGYSPIGMNGYYMNSRLAAYATAGLQYRIGNGKWKNIIGFNAFAYLEMRFPKPFAGRGIIGGSFIILNDTISKSFNYEFGPECNPTYPSSNSDQLFEEENVADGLGVIFQDILVENGDQDYNPEEALKWITSYEPGETFTLPERQADGTVKSRSFKVEWESQLWEWNEENQSYKYISFKDLAKGKDPVGRWCMAKEVAVYGEPIKVGLSTGSEFDETSIWLMETAFDELQTGDFDGNGFSDLLVKKSDNQWYIYLNNGLKFFIPPAPLLISNLLSKTPKLGDFNGDKKIDFLLVRDDGTPEICLSKGFVNNNIEFEAPEIWPTNAQELSLGEEYNFKYTIGDFNGDDYDDIMITGSVKKGLDGSEPSPPSIYLREATPETTHDGDEIEIGTGTVEWFSKLTVFTSNGSSFKDGKVWTDSAPRNDLTYHQTPVTTARPQWYVMNFDNSDGRNRDDIFCICATGDGFKGGGRTPSKLTSKVTAGNNYFEDYIYNSIIFGNLFGDFDGDGEEEFLPEIELNYSDVEESKFNDNYSGSSPWLLDRSLNGQYEVGNFNDGLETDYLIYNINSKYKKEDDWYSNNLTPETKYKLILSGRIKEGQTVVYTEPTHEIVFTTGKSEKITNKIAANAKDESVFPGNTSTGSTVVITDVNSNNNKTNVFLPIAPPSGQEINPMIKLK